MTIPGKEIFRSHDRFGPVMVFDDGNKRFLAFDQKDQQSCQLKTQPTQLQYDYTRAMLLPLLLCPAPKRALLLGLGGGSLAGCLHHYWQELQVTAVELRPAVIKVAYSHFQLPRCPRLEVLKDDAGSFMRKQEQACTVDGAPQQDLIFSDIYSAGGMDDLQRQEHYLDQCRQILSDNGWLVLNFWKEHRDDDILPMLKERFADLRMCTTQSGNWVILASPRCNQLSEKHLNDQARLLSQTLGFSVQPLLARLRKVL